jgi:hypothetical protein
MSNVKMWKSTDTVSVVFFVRFCWGFMLVLYFTLCARIIILCRHHFVNKIFCFHFDTVYSLRGELWGEMWVHNWKTHYNIILYSMVLIYPILYHTIPYHTHSYYFTKRVLLVRSLTSYIPTLRSREILSTKNHTYGTGTRERNSLSYVRSRIMMSSNWERGYLDTLLYVRFVLTKSA